MGNYATTKEEVKNNIIARVPLIVVQSSERERVERMLRELTSELRTDIYYYTDVKQFCSLASGSSKDTNDDPLYYFQDTLKKKRGATLALGDAKRISEENSFSRELLDTLYLALENSGTIVIVTHDYIWSRLAQFGLMTTLDYPDDEERETQIKKFVKAYRGKYSVEWNEADIRQAALLLRGFSEVQIENVLSYTLVSSGRLDRNSLFQLTKQKSRLYAAVPCVDEVKVPDSMAISGLENLREWMALHKEMFFLSDDVLKEYDLTPPKGILLAGVPGCGKSYSAKIAAAEWGLPLFRFDIGGIYDKWVGESEKKMLAALKFIDNVAPCIVWIDEIEKALSTSEIGNDTGKRVLGQFLFWLQESASRVFLVATANDVSKLPPELFRKGRFSEIFFVDLPNRSERSSAISQYMLRCLHVSPEADCLEELVQLSEGFSYSDIECTIKEAARMKLLGEGESVPLAEMFRRNLSFSGSNPDVLRDIQQWGRERAVPASKKE